MKHIQLGMAIGTVALTGLVGAGVGVGYYVMNLELDDPTIPKGGR